MHRECVYKLWASINRQDLRYRCFHIVTLTEASAHFPISKIHTKTQILKVSIQCGTIFAQIWIKIFLELMHRECVSKLWASINRQDLSYRRFHIVTLTEASAHFPISKIHTKSQILKVSIQCSTIFTQIWIKIFLELLHRECVYKLWACINRPDLSYRRFHIVTLIEAKAHLSMSKMHTKSQISHFEKFHTVQHNFLINLDNNIFRTYA